MKKYIFIITVLIAAQSIQAQSLSFSLDTLKRDSFYLIEVYTAAPTKDAPRAGTTVTPQLFRDTAQLKLYIANLRSDAKAAKEQAQKYEQASRLWALKAKAIQELIEKSDWFMGRNSVTPPPKPPANKPTKKKN
jgi:hypothetical protein